MPFLHKNNLGGSKRGDGGDDGPQPVTYPEPELPVTHAPAGRIIGKPPQTTKKPEEDSCALPIDPAVIDIPPDSFRFSKLTLRFFSSIYQSFLCLGTPDGRLEYPHPRGKHSKSFTYSLEFKTELPDGILFYVANADRDQYIVVLLRNGKVTNSVITVVKC